VGVPGRPKWTAIACNAMNSRVDPDVICGAVVRDREQDRAAAVVDRRVRHDPAVGAVDPGRHLVHQISASSASVNTSCTWVEVSSPETMCASHLRDTRSSTTVEATRPR
jgi:hypothetical protein